jgi:hypothetical protein
MIIDSARVRCIPLCDTDSWNKHARGESNAPVVVVQMNAVSMLGVPEDESDSDSDGDK